MSESKSSFLKILVSSVKNPQITIIALNQGDSSKDSCRTSVAILEYHKKVKVKKHI